jgi:hypothetical protein
MSGSEIGKIAEATRCAAIPVPDRSKGTGTNPLTIRQKAIRPRTLGELARQTEAVG